jgi:aminopeptidase N
LIGVGLLTIGAVLLVSTQSLRGQMARPAGRVFGNPSVWQWAPSRTYHVENYKLRLHFDQAKGEVFGDEAVTLRPFAPNFRKFYLNSSELTIDSVTLDSSQSAPVNLEHVADTDRLWITLDRDYEPANSLSVRIVYHGFPRFGLFFVNPDADYPDRPKEIHTQGEAEFNHLWFPCWDYPNDMATSETITTVPEGQVVVSNGKLVSVTHADGQVTYDWVESVPHSSYLVSLAIGPWHKVSDHYEDKPVDYYVPPSVDDATARRSFRLTPDMIGFFSRATGVDYPYEQYAQVTVRNYIFGGQENVSATTLTENTLHDERADQDYPSTSVVAHELGQHWFGDLVQGRDWANIWLNEGFATYLEALYTQHHDGNDAFRFEIYNDQLAAQAQDRDDYLRPIVDRHYTDAMQMFDSITHEKGAAVLDMLRYVVDGQEAAAHPASQDEILFRAFNHYLTAHRAEAADTPELIAAIRDTTGMELGWFFREWIYMAGTPSYRVAASYDPAKKIEKVSVTQTQHVDEMTPIFDMPIELAFYRAGGESKKAQVRDNLQTQEFDIPLDFEPEWVDFDPDDFIDKAVEFVQPVSALIAEAEKDPAMMSRLWATQQLGTATGEDGARIATLARVLANDNFYGVRATAAMSLGKIAAPSAKAVLLGALKQSDSRVRTAVVAALGTFAKEREVFAALEDALRNDPSYAVQAAAVQQISESGDTRAFDILRAEIEAKPEIHVMQAALVALTGTRDPRAAAILLAQARPGVPERIRVSALSALLRAKEAIEPGHHDELVGVVAAALRDSFLPIQEAGERLVGTLKLTQFQAEIESVRNSPFVMQRDLVQRVLAQLNISPK